MDVVIQFGILRSWDKNRGFGFLEVPRPVFPQQKYFLHAADILEGVNPPPVGSRVRFEAGPPRRNGKYPCAEKAWIVATKSGVLS